MEWRLARRLNIPRQPDTVGSLEAWRARFCDQLRGRLLDKPINWAEIDRDPGLREIEAHLSENQSQTAEGF